MEKHSNFRMLDPFEDELIYSAVARTHLLMDHRSKQETLQKAFGIRTTNFRSATIVSSLSVSKDPKLCLDHTAYSYYLSSLYLKRQKKFLKSFVEPEGEKTAKEVTLSVDRRLAKPALFYCPECLKEDHRDYGMPYFHRLHQLEGVTACPKHQLRLVSYKKKPSLHFSGPKP